MVQSIHVVDGQPVRKGDVLVELEGQLTEADIKRLGSELLAAQIDQARASTLLSALDSDVAPASLAPLIPQATAAQQVLITDLFEKITTYDFKVASARKSRRADGRWELSIDIDAQKFYADPQGTQTEAPLEAVIDVGVFTADPAKPGFGADRVLHLQHHEVRSGRQTLTLVVDEEPAFVGADPYSNYIDITPTDNVVAIVGD